MRKTAALYHCWCHTRESGVSGTPQRSDSIKHSGILDHPLSRVTTQKELPLPWSLASNPFTARASRKLALARCRAHRRLEAAFQRQLSANFEGSG